MYMKILKSIRNRERVKVLLLSALIITLILILPRLVLILYLKFNNPGGSYNFQHAGDGLVLKLLFTSAIAVLCLFVNTSKFRLKYRWAGIDLNSFYQRVIINIVLYSVIRAATIGYNRNAPGFAVTEKFQDFFSVSPWLLKSFFVCWLPRYTGLWLATRRCGSATRHLKKPTWNPASRF